MTATADQAIAYAMTELGKPYVYGAEGPGEFDCSGLVQYVFAHLGIHLPRTAAQQQAATKRVDQPKPGDLVFYGTPAYHVGIYLGAGKMVDAPHTGALVRTQAVGTPTSFGRVPGLTITGQIVAATSAAATTAASTVTSALGLPSLTADIQQVAYEALFAVLGLALIGAGVYKLASPSIKKAATSATGIGA
jgi:hypothetical protein